MPIKIKTLLRPLHKGAAAAGQRPHVRRYETLFPETAAPKSDPEERVRSPRERPEPRQSLQPEPRRGSRTHRHIVASDGVRTGRANSGSARGSPGRTKAAGGGTPGTFKRAGRGEKESGRERERSGRCRHSFRLGRGGMSPVRRAEGCARRHAIPLRAPPPKMSPRVHVLAPPNLLVLPDPRLGLRAAAIGWQRGAAPSDWCWRAAPPRPCPAGCAAGGAGQVAAMAAV